jgi:hypothetical protein
MTVDNSVLLSTKHEYRLNKDTLFEVVTVKEDPQAEEVRFCTLS